METRVYGGISVSHYEKAVLDLLKEGHKQRKSLLEHLCPKIMSQKKLQKTLNELESAGKAVSVSKRIEGRKNWTTWYMLPGQEYLFDVDAARIIAAVERLKQVLLRMPTVDEIAVEAGITPTEAEQLAYKLATQTGWFNPAPELIRDARVKLGEALVCAARIRDKHVTEDGKSESFDYNDDAEIVKEAKRFLKDYPQLLPKLADDGDEVVSWSQEALRFLGENYTPESRNRPYVGVASPRYR
ncbi:MAG: hypothetical protein NWE99_01020 [Candidatus Bathyarchaeota archaeon]|nr:hypothetical protein [Candidatus Bathyarchaeota archaeon]